MNVADVEEMDPLGPLVIDVSGSTVSTVHVRDAGVVSMFPAASIALTWKVCEAWLNPV